MLVITYSLRLLAKALSASKFPISIILIFSLYRFQLNFSIFHGTNCFFTISFYKLFPLRRVKLGVHEETGEQVAVKIMDKSDIKAQEMTMNVRREIAIMKALNHRNIVNLQQVLTSQSKLYIVMDLVTGGELFTKILKEGKLPEKTARHYFQQLVDGIEYCHRRGVCHRDLKPENLLIDETTGELKITDFGLSAMKGASTTEELLHTQCGSPNYCAPEIIARHKQGYNGAKVDAWSCGIILFALLAGYLPFYDENTKVLYRMIQRDDVKFPKKFPIDAKDLVLRLLHKDPEMRYTLVEVKKHPWFIINYDGGDPARSDTSKNGASSSPSSVVRRKRRGHARKSSVDQAPRPRRSERSDQDHAPHTHTGIPTPPPVVDVAAPRTILSAHRPPPPATVTTPPVTPPMRLAATPPVPSPPPPLPPFAPPPPPSIVKTSKPAYASNTIHPPPPPYPVPPYSAPETGLKNNIRENRPARGRDLSSDEPISGGTDTQNSAGIPPIPRFPPPVPTSRQGIESTVPLSLPLHQPFSYQSYLNSDGEKPESPVSSPFAHLSSVPIQINMESESRDDGANSIRGALRPATALNSVTPPKAPRTTWDVQAPPPPPSYPAAIRNVATHSVDEGQATNRASPSQDVYRQGPKSEPTSNGIEGSSKVNGVDVKNLSLVERRKIMYNSSICDGDGNDTHQGSTIPSGSIQDEYTESMEIRYEDRPGTRTKSTHIVESGSSAFNPGPPQSSMERYAWSREGDQPVGGTTVPKPSAPSRLIDVEKDDDIEGMDEFKRVRSNAPLKERLAAAMARYRRIFRLGTMVGITSSPSFSSNKRQSNVKDDDDNDESAKSSKRRSDFFSRAKAVTGAWGIILSQELEDDSDSDDERLPVTEAELEAFSRLLDFWDNRRTSATVTSGTEVVLDDEETSPLSEEDIANIQSLLHKLEPKPVEEELVEVDGADGYATSGGGSMKSRSGAGSMHKIDSSGNHADDEDDDGTGGSSKTVVRIDSTDDMLEADHETSKGSEQKSEYSPSGSPAPPAPPLPKPPTPISRANGTSSSVGAEEYGPPPPPLPPPPSRVLRSSGNSPNQGNKTVVSSSLPPAPPVVMRSEYQEKFSAEKPPARHRRNRSRALESDHDVNGGSVGGEVGAEWGAVGAPVGSDDGELRLKVTPSTVRDPFRPKPGGIYRGVRGTSSDGGDGEIGASGLKVRIDPAVDQIKGHGDGDKESSLMGSKRKSSATGSEKEGEGRKTISRDSGRMHSAASEGSGAGHAGRKRGHLRTPSRDEHATRGLFAFNVFNRRKSNTMTSFDAKASPENCLLEIGRILISMGCSVMMKKGENKMKCDVPIRRETLKASITCSRDGGITTVHLKKARRDKSQVDAKEFYEFFQNVHSRFLERIPDSSVKTV